MKYMIYKFDFLAGVHFGNGSLTEVNNTFYADTLFSALCIEAAKMNNDYLDKLCDYVKSGRLLFSDGFPYIGDIFYLPKPIKKVDKTDDRNQKEKKAFKKMEYIPANKLDDYFKGSLSAGDESKYLNSKLGNYVMKTSAVVKEGEDTVPFHVQYYRFAENAGLYIILSYDDEEVRGIFDELIEGLSYSGIGGERSSGYGRFEIKVSKMPDYILNRLVNSSKISMLLSVSLPTNDEMESVMKDADYVLLKRSGFAVSDKYNEIQRRKRDIFMFKSGSCFSEIYCGDVYDVRTNEEHAVYKYGKALWLGVDV